MKRLSYLFRMAFHDWMWGAHLGLVHRDEPTWAMRCARRLPLYFSDPEYDPREFDRAMREGEGVELDVNLARRRPTITINPPATTWSSGTTTNITWL